LKTIFNYCRRPEINKLNPPIDQWLERLQASGYRLTGPRRALVEVMAGSQKALGPVDLYELGRARFPGLGLVTVYRTLEKLEELGLIARVHLPDGCHRYLPATQGHQHLLLCTCCGQVAYFAGDELGGLFQNVASDTGYAIEEHWLQLFGQCPECAQNDSDPAPVGQSPENP